MRRPQLSSSCPREQSIPRGQTSQHTPQKAIVRPEQPTLNEQHTTTEQRTPAEQRTSIEHQTLTESSLTPANENAWIVGSTHSDGRLRVDVIDDILEPSNTCAHKITAIIYERLEPTGFNWKTVTNVTQDFYFEEFKKYFVWRPQLSDRVLFDAWLKSARRRYSDICYSAR